MSSGGGDHGHAGKVLNARTSNKSCPNSLKVRVCGTFCPPLQHEPFPDSVFCLDERFSVIFLLRRRTPADVDEHTALVVPFYFPRGALAHDATYVFCPYHRSERRAPWRCRGMVVGSLYMYTLVLARRSEKDSSQAAENERGPRTRWADPVPGRRDTLGDSQMFV